MFYDVECLWVEDGEPTARDLMVGYRLQPGSEAIVAGDQGQDIGWLPEPFVPPLPFRRGDVDDSGVVDISDPLNSLEFQFLGTFTPPCMDAADTDDSGTVDISDPLNNLSFQFLGTFTIPAPGPDDCGLDPTADDDSPGIGGDLGCASYTTCP